MIVNKILLDEGGTTIHVNNLQICPCKTTAGSNVR